MKYLDRSEDDDDQMGCEEYEDVVAYTMENDFWGIKLGSELLSEIDILAISEMADELVSNRQFEIEFSTGSAKFELSEYSEVSDYFEEVPGISTLHESVDDSPGNSESWKVYLLEQGANPETVASDIRRLFETLSGFQSK